MRNGKGKVGKHRVVKVLFMGTPEFAIPSLKQVCAAGYDIVAVVTQPDRPAGRGLKATPSPVAVEAERLGLRVLKPPRASATDFIRNVTQSAPHIIVVAAYGKLLKPELLDIPAYGSVNLHPSLLPKYRGAAPINWAIINGERETGVTTFYVSEEMDAGDIILQRSVPIAPEDTAGTLDKKLADAGSDLLVETLRVIEQGNPPRSPQDARCATYARKLSKEDGTVDWRLPAEQVHNLVRGVTPQPGTCAELTRASDGKPILIKLWKTAVVEEQGQPGTVTAVHPHGIVIACGKGALLVKEAQPAGKKQMSVSSFLAGNRIAVGSKVS